MSRRRKGHHGVNGEEHARIDAAVKRFEAYRAQFERLARSLVDCLTSHKELQPLTHFVRSRVKTSESLYRKLVQIEEAGTAETRRVNESNVFDEMGDLAGVRLIYLHTNQMAEIHPAILDALAEDRYELVGDVVAYCWDVEYEKFFQKCGITAKSRESMYTTVHYDVRANRKSGIRCELQVRSLMDEVWGEVSHRVNYPVESPSKSCRDQLKVLARLTTGGSRLVDSIFDAHGRARSNGNGEFDEGI